MYDTNLSASSGSLTYQSGSSHDVRSVLASVPLVSVTQCSLLFSSGHIKPVRRQKRKDTAKGKYTSQTHLSFEIRKAEQNYVFMW